MNKKPKYYEDVGSPLVYLLFQRNSSKNLIKLFISLWGWFWTIYGTVKFQKEYRNSPWSKVGIRVLPYHEVYHKGIEIKAMQY